MSEIKRWEFHIAPIGLGECNCEDRENSNGDYVLYSDYAQKEAECAELKEVIEKHLSDLSLLKDKFDKENAQLRERVRELEEMPIVCPVHKEKLEELESEIEDLKRELNKCDCGICNWCNGDTYYHIKRKLRAKEHDFQLLSSLYSEPIHLGMFYNEEEGIKTIYILDKDGNETDREVKAECLLKRISKYFNRAKSAEAQLEEARKALEGITKIYNKYKDSKYALPSWQESMLTKAELDFWNAIKQAALAGKEGK